MDPCSVESSLVDMDARDPLAGSDFSIKSERGSFFTVPGYRHDPSVILDQARHIMPDTFPNIPYDIIYTFSHNYSDCYVRIVCNSKCILPQMRGDVNVTDAISNIADADNVDDNAAIHGAALLSRSRIGTVVFVLVSIPTVTYCYTTEHEFRDQDREKEAN